jgi:16S rRNA (cytosine967-C5)-methyltransferase
VTPAARLQAAIELLDEIITSARRDGAAADTLIARYFKTRRYAGSKDRAAVRESVYRVLRSAFVEKSGAGRDAVIKVARNDMPDWLSLFDGTAHGPEIIPDNYVPEMISSYHAPALDILIRGGVENPEAELAALLTRAPLDLRVNLTKTSREEAAAKLLAEGIATSVTPFSLVGLRCGLDKPNIEMTKTFLGGFVEIQDEGSQLVALLAHAKPGETVIDLCAGAGGKTLALADSMEGAGRLIAHDIDAARLARLRPRAERAGLSGFIEYRDKGLEELVGAADCVVVDAPCTGSGTWRRNPEARLRPILARLPGMQSIQRDRIVEGAELLKPGGRLVYAVCSVLDQEGVDHLADLPPGLTVVDWRQLWPSDQRKPETAAGCADCLKLTPLRHDCDGFTIMCLENSR